MRELATGLYLIADRTPALIMRRQIWYEMPLRSRWTRTRGLQACSAALLCPLPVIALDLQFGSGDRRRAAVSGRPDEEHELERAGCRVGAEWEGPRPDD